MRLWAIYADSRGIPVVLHTCTPQSAPYHTVRYRVISVVSSRYRGVHVVSYSPLFFSSTTQTPPLSVLLSTP